MITLYCNSMRIALNMFYFFFQKRYKMQQSHSPSTVKTQKPISERGKVAYLVE